MASLVEKVLKLKNSDGRAGINQDALINVLVETVDVVENGGGGGSADGLVLKLCKVEDYPIEDFTLKVIRDDEPDHVDLVLSKGNLDVSCFGWYEDSETGIWYGSKLELYADGSLQSSLEVNGEPTVSYDENGEYIGINQSWSPGGSDFLTSFAQEDTENPGKCELLVYPSSESFHNQDFPYMTDEEIIAWCLSEIGASSIDCKIVVEED